MKLWAIIEFTFREGLARKTIIGFAVISTFFLLLGVVAALVIPTVIEVGNGQGVNTRIDITADAKIVWQVQAAMTGFINFAALVLSIFATASILPNTMDKGSIDLLLSKPVSRLEILLGKTLGSLLIVLANVAYFIIGMWLIVGVRTGEWNAGFLGVTFSITYTFLILFAVMLVIGIGSRSSALTIILLYVFIFLISPILEGREFILQLASSETAKVILDTIYYILPKPDALGKVSYALVTHTPIDWMPIWSSGLFAAVMYAFAGWLFQRKDF
ncbi:MAG: ABC transporter permease subunit [Bacteroidota bacterium]|jgi:ABC-type transport system involved in multi-copper enzyme maturation permease subunit